ncbi:Uncharacterized protein APZ42_021156 [Daphnia magna]|uniref:Transmembrane protein n=1 Tax=Daphnia magna TaxID=35525 RepID=A0A164X165_9CRUS|nr:Uncharacterized protein APZ42_021156 [Daphnia magna]
MCTRRSRNSPHDSNRQGPSTCKLFSFFSIFLLFFFIFCFSTTVVVMVIAIVTADRCIVEAKNRNDERRVWEGSPSFPSPFLHRLLGFYRG